jgi:hypothetical protein
MAISLTPEQQYDAFGRLRMSQPETLYETSHVGMVDQYMDFSGSYTYDPSHSHVSLDSSGGRTSIMQSLQIIPYQPGKSMLYFGSFFMSDSITSVERIGFFNGSHGLYLEKNNGTLSFNVKRDGDTSANSVQQSEWNLRKLDKIDRNLDYTKGQILWMDFEWLGVGAVVFGFVINRLLLPCHRFDHANDVLLPYIRHAKLPFRAEITESGAITKSFKHVCASIMSEGGFQLKGHVHSIGTSEFRDIDTSAGTWVIAIRIHPDYAQDMVVVPSSISTSVQSNQTIKCGKITIYDHITDISTTWTTTANGIVQYSFDPSITTTTSPVDTFYVESQGSLNVNSNLNLQLKRTIQGVPIPLAIKIGSLTSTAISTAIAITWREI